MSDAPKDRDALIEVMARAINPSLWAKIDQWIADDDWNGATALNARATCLRETEKVLEALESSGCFVGPVVATPDMVTQTKTCDMRKQGRFYDIWTAMQSANPYRKE